MMNTIRKFGLEHCDLPTMIWNLSVWWRTFTINIDKRNTKRIPIIFYILGIIISLGCFYVYVISVIWFVFIKCRETRDIIAATIVFSLGVAAQISTSKLIFMLLNQQKIRDIVEEYLNSNSMLIPMKYFHRTTKKTLRIVKKRATTFWLVVIVNGLLYGGKPIVMPGRHLSEDVFIYYGLEPMYESPNYEIALFASSCGIVFTVYLTANISALLIVIVGYNEAQLLGLSEEIKHVWKDAMAYVKTKPVIIIANDKIVINQYVQRTLTEIIKRHTVIINLVKKTEDIFKGAIAMEFVLITIFLVSTLLGGLENTYLQIPFSIMQVAMDCLVGQRMIDASIVFENAVYACEWENFNNANMKTVLLLLQNSQKTLTLSAGGVTILNFASFGAVMKSIYSTYTALRSTVK